MTAINEFDLEARIHAVLKQIFPSFLSVGLKHQKIFSFRLGHHNVSVDNVDPKNHTRAISDVLLSLADKPVMLLELKRPGHALDGSDLDQGISYARLIPPMPPIVVLSNGDKSQMYNTYTKKPLDEEALDAAILQRILNQGASLAKDDIQSAINVLLNRMPETLISIMLEINTKNFQFKKGDISDLLKPISEEFQIKRKITQRIYEAHSNGANLIGVMGPAFSGRTTTLYQFFIKYAKRDNHLVFFVDCDDHLSSIIQQLSTALTRELDIYIGAEKVREWLISLPKFNPSIRLFLLIDNFKEDVNESFKNEVYDLLDAFRGSSNSIIYTIDEFNFNKIAHVTDRKYISLIGNLSKIIRLKSLDEEEYDKMNGMLEQKFRCFIGAGGKHSQEYRHPRVMRQIMSYMKTIASEDSYAKIPPLLNHSSLLALTNNALFTTKIKKQYGLLADTLLAGITDSKFQLPVPFHNNGLGTVLVKSFKHRHGNDYKKLQKNGLAIVRNYQDGVSMIIPKIPELLAYAAVGVITERILEKSRKASIVEITDLLVTLSNACPYADLVGAAVLIEVMQRDDTNLAIKIIQRLLDLPPSSDPIKAGTKAAFLTEDHGPIVLNFEDDMGEEAFISNHLPYVILGNVSRFGLFVLDTDGPERYDFQLYMLKTLASNKYPSIRVYVNEVTDMQCVEMITIADVGTIISGKEGIIEPIVLAIQDCCGYYPELITALYEQGIEERNFILLWRVYLAVREMQGSTKENDQVFFETFKEKYNVVFDDMMSDILTNHIIDPEERNEMKEKIRGFKVWK